MLLEACIVSIGLHYGSKLYNKIKQSITQKENESATDKMNMTAAKQEALSETSEITPFEKEVNHYLSMSVGSTALAISGAVIHPVFSILGISLMLYCDIPIFKAGWEAIFKERRPRIEISETIAIALLFACKYYVVNGLLTVGYFSAHKLRLRTEKKVKKKYINLFGDHPGTVWILKDGIEVEIAFEALQAGDVIVVTAGEMIPADGIVISGIGLVDQRMLTGESQPVEKEIGSQVFASTMVISGNLHIRAERTGNETVAIKIMNILQNTEDFTRQIESHGQEIADSSVIPGLVLCFCAMPFLGMAETVALFSSNFLINMRIASPLSMLNFLYRTSKEGILIKDGRSLQLLSQVDMVVFDKTGTLTLDQPSVFRIITFGNTDENTVLALAATAEQRQTHPIARAILKESENRNLKMMTLDQSNYKIGFGITVRIGKQTVRVGSERFMNIEKMSIPTEFQSIRENAYQNGNSVICVAEGDQVIGAIELEPVIRPEIQTIINRLKKYHMKLCILSGDHINPTRKMAETLGIDTYFAEVLPEDKANMIDFLQKNGRKVCFVGDGINDSIALKKAAVSVSIRGASTAATDSAQIVLMDQTLKKLTDLFDIAHAFKKNMENTFYAVGIPSLVSIGGVFFAHFKLAHVTFLYAVSLSSGMITAMIPKKEIPTVFI